jgi:hypothetical protein
MRIHGIMLIKDEADVIRATITEALRWIDRIYVLDNGSTDGTWEIVRELAGTQVVPWKQDTRTYSNALRAEVFHAFREQAQEGDWWCYKMDSDEFYVDDPRSFLSGVPRHHHVVYKRSIDYVLTEEDVAELEFSGEFAEDRPKIRYFISRAYSEPRFFRHRSRLTWPLDHKSPRHMGIPHPEPITVRHYQWRSPEQIKRRIEARKRIPRDKRGKPFRHVQQAEWQEALGRRADLTLDDGGLDLRSVPLRRPVGERGPSYWARRLLHGTGILP